MRRSQPLRQLAGLLASSTCAGAGQRMAQVVSACAASERLLSSQTASTSGSSTPSYWSFAALPLLGLACAGTAAADAPADTPEKSEGFHLLPLNSRQRIFFKYEKRIRDKSTLDKVFEYFSSIEKDRHKFLTPVDLLRAVVPTYPPSESHMDRSGSLDGERHHGRPQPFWSKAQTSFFAQFDVDGDGLISYPEFLLVVTLLSISEKDVKTIFDVVDLDGNGQIDAEEFKSVVELLQAMANVHTSKVGRSHKLSLDSESGILVSFFGKDGTKKLNLPEFQGFLTKLHEEVVRLEFAHYDNLGRGSMAPVDFARSLIGTADIRHVDRLLDRATALESDASLKRVPFDEFLRFHRVQRQLHTLQVALDFCDQVERPVTKADFVKLLKKLLGISLAPNTVDIVFAVFADAAGNLDSGRFMEVLQRREVMWGRRRTSDLDSYHPGTLARAFACVTQCWTDHE